MKVRRVVTGHTPEGKSTVASDTEVDGITMLRSEHHRLWGADEVLTFPDDGSPPPFTNYFPPVGGFRFALFTVRPQSEVRRDQIDENLMAKDLEEKMPGALKYFEPDNPGMHTTDTIDFVYVISGEVWLELDNGEEVHLKPGDTVVQNGTRHAWRNKGSEPCRMVGCLIGARRR